MGHRPRRTVEAHLGILGQLRAQAAVQCRDMGDAPLLILQRQTQRRLHRHRHPQRRRAAAVGRGAAAAVNLRLDDQV